MGFLDRVLEECFLKIKSFIKKDEFKPLLLILVEVFGVFSFLFSNVPSNQRFLSIVSPIPSILTLIQQKNTNSEIFGFAPYWKFDSLDNVDFNVLTTFAYFGVPVNSDGILDKTDQGYITFKSDKATQIFSKAHSFGTRIVLTLTNMDNSSIEQFLDNPDAQNEAIKEAVSEVKDRGIDGINVDFEYLGDPGQTYRDEFTNFVGSLNSSLHRQVPSSKLSVSVYASSVKDPKIYNIQALADKSDDIFMMAYDFAVRDSQNAIPTAPLYGYKQGQYWYDVSTAVSDFLKVMPSNKLILGVPWYGYDYAVDKPEVKAQTGQSYTYWYKHWISPWYWVWRQGYSQIPATIQTYATSINDVKTEKAGWDNLGKVGWKAYKADDGTWRMFFMEDSKSLGVKYDFAKKENLKGVGVWALGFDEGKSDMWQLLKQKFGNKMADNLISERTIQ